MEGKKEQILRAAIALFSEKGYRGTSIQDIADALGIAKGSLYFYFKSKEDLLLSICGHFLSRMNKQLQALYEREDLTGREKLCAHIAQHFGHFHEYKAFMRIFLQESFEINEQIHRYAIAAKRRAMYMNWKLIGGIYGEEAREHAVDATVMLHALTDGYIGLMFLENKKFEADELAAFIVDRLDDLMDGMTRRGGKPVMGAEEAEQWRAFAADEADAGRAALLAEIALLRTAAESGGLDGAAAEELESALQIMEAELAKEHPQPVVLKGMAALLKTVKPAALKKHAARIEELAAGLDAGK